MDIANFRMIRPARRHADERALRLTGIPKFKPVAEAWSRLPFGPATTGADVVLPPLDVPLDAAALSAVTALTVTERGSILAVISRILALLYRLEVHFAESNDRISGTDLRNLIAGLSKRYGLDSVDWSEFVESGDEAIVPFSIAQLVLQHALRDALTRRAPNFELATRLCRWTLVASLLELWGGRLPQLTTEIVFDHLNRWPVVLVGLSAGDLVPGAQVKLIREAQVADLEVVRREWAGYLASEIANIRNVMAGESFGQTDKTTRETETTAETAKESRELTEREDQSKLQSELSQEVNSQLSITVYGHAEASAEFKYPVVTARVSGGMDAGLALQRSERQASKIARETVNRALSRVDSMARESRIRRELMRTEQGMSYTLDNSDGGNVHGVYRWVDQVDTYQLFRYPDRFLLEFQIPEPAEFFRWRTERQQQADQLKDKPPEWTLTLEDIKAEELVKLGSRYHASNLPAAPDQRLSILRTLIVEMGKDAVPQEDKILMNPPAAAKEVEIPIPTDYAATKVHYEGRGFPVLTKWGLTEGGFEVGYRSAFATVSIGDTSALYWNGGISKKGTQSMRFLATHGSLPDQGVVEEVQSENPPYGRAILVIGKGGDIDPDPDTVPISPPAVNMVKVALSAVGVLSCTVTFCAECELTKEAYSAWQLSVYDALYAAWAQWKKDYASAFLREVLVGASPTDPGSSQRNEQIIREELKREVISWLLDDSAFAGRPGLHKRPVETNTTKETDFADIDFDQARLDAPTIQFLEQAFEWNNMTYMFYPYYWAQRVDWERRSQLVANDPEFERFLRAGSARVILPARPGFEDAVKNWLYYRVPYSGQLPSPDEDLYVSIDKEIRELTSPWEGGIPGDTWQARVSTTLLYLETKGDLPFTNAEHQLPAPKGVPYAPKPIIEFS